MLDSWNDGEAKTAILEFVRSVTTPGDSFVAPEARIATFDNDGTLWVEKPHYTQAEFVMRRRGVEAEGDVEPETTKPGRGRKSEDRSRLARLLDHAPDVIAGVAEVTKGMTTEAFERIVREFFDTAVHPTLGVPYTKLAYRPMVELLGLLRDNGFHVYICTGGGRDFVRVISHELYGIERDHVIGSAGALEYRDGDIYRKKGIELPIDDGPGKPVHIWQRTGRKPLFACGNANGDSEMLRIAKFSVLIHHDDAEREFAYDTKAEKVLAQAQFGGWTVVSMKNDFREVF
jgi:phosphoserine phosphatase